MILTLLNGLLLLLKKKSLSFSTVVKIRTFSSAQNRLTNVLIKEIPVVV